jgi:hypothetical protein
LCRRAMPTASSLTMTWSPAHSKGRASGLSSTCRSRRGKQQQQRRRRRRREQQLL